MLAVPPSQFWCLTKWDVIGAVLGRGLLLLGRTDDRRRAVVIAPPGVYLETPHTPEARDIWQGPSTSDGWRIAEYYRADGPVMVDQQPPEALHLTSLSVICGVVARHATQHGDWLADRLERQVRYAALTAQQATQPSTTADERWLGVQFMLDELDAIHRSPTLSTSLRAADGRLGPNYLRDLAEQLELRARRSSSPERVQ